MQAITVKVIPATNAKPTRLKAITASGLSVTVSANEYSPEAAVRKLCQRLDWHGALCHGWGHNGDAVFVFVTDETRIDV